MAGVMADSEEDYSSSDDSDYVPEDAVSDSDSGEEDQDGTEEISRSKGKGKKIKKDSQLTRKRKGGIKLEGEEEDDTDEKCLDEDQEQSELEQERKALEEEEKKAREAEEEEREKKRADDLWKSLLSDVGPRPKITAASVSKISSSVPSERKETVKEAAPGDGDAAPGDGDAAPGDGDAAPGDGDAAPGDGDAAPGDGDAAPGDGDAAPGEKRDAASSSSQKTVTVTKVFDFAGEEVKVTKAVKVDSKEADILTKKPAEQVAKSTSGPLPGLPLGGKRKPGGIGSVLGKINKKPKISVLEKSKLDWDSFKKKEGIEEDLRIHNKGKEGFLQKQDFLREADLRQYEIERKMRMGQSGR